MQNVRALALAHRAIPTPTHSPAFPAIAPIWLRSNKVGIDDPRPHFGWVGRRCFKDEDYG